MDILEPPPRTEISNQFVVTITDRYSKLTRALLTAKITSTQVADIFSYERVMTCGIPGCTFFDNGQQDMSMFFTLLCMYLKMKRLRTTVFHPQTNGQVERYNKTLVSRLRLHVPNDQQNRDIFAQLLTYAYNSLVYRSMDEAYFTLTFSKVPASPITITGPSALP